MNNFKFDPWNGIEGWYEGKPIDVSEPPCKHCMFWKPVVGEDEGDDTGVILCHNNKQHQDFSCFIGKNEKELKCPHCNHRID